MYRAQNWLDEGALGLRGSGLLAQILEAKCSCRKKHPRKDAMPETELSFHSWVTSPTEE